MIEQDNDELYVAERKSAPEVPLTPASMSPEEYLEFRKSQKLTERTWYQDVARGVYEAPQQVLGGARDAVQETVNFAGELGEWLDENVANLGEITITEDGLGYNRGEPGIGDLEAPTLPEVERGDSVTGNMVRGVSQFLVGFAGANKFLGKVKPVTNVGKVGKSMAAGAMADAVVFDPKDPRLSNLIKEHTELDSPITDYLAASPDDSQAEGRFKNALEGLGLGALAEGLFMAVRGIKGTGKIQAAATDVVEEGADSTRHAIVTGKEEEALSAEAKAILEDEERIKRTPLVQVSKEDSDAFAALVKEGNLEKAGENLHFNLDRISDKEGIHEVINLASDVFQKELDKGVKPPRTHKTVKELAREMGTSVEKLNSVFSNVKNLDSHVLGVRQLLASSADRVFNLAEAASSGDKEAMVKLRQAAALHASIQGEVKGVQTEIARAMSAMRIEAKTTKARNRELDHILETFGGDRVNKEFADRILQAKAAGKDARNQLSNALRSGWWARTRDAVIAMRANGLLSNPSTHMINISGNMLTILNNVSERAIAARIGGQEGVQAGEAMAMLNGMTGSFMEALSMAWKATKTGAPGDTFTKLDYNHNAISGEAFDASGNIGKAIDYVGVTLGIPGRMLVAGDEFFKTMAYRAEIHATAFRKVSQSGLEGQAAKDKLAELIADPTSDIKAGAVDFANYSTFTKDLTGASKLVSDLAAKVPMVRLFIPFIRTPLNIVKYAGERTPFLRKHVDWIKNDLESGDPARIQLTKAKLATGNMLYMTGMMMAANGLITGSPPANRESARRWQEYGWQPNSVKIGDTYYPYNRADPFGMFLGFASDLVTMGDAWGDEEYEEMAQVAMASLHSNLIDKNYLAGLSQMFEVIGSDENSLWKLEKAGKNIAVSTIPYSSLLRGITRTNDNVVREANDVWEEMKKNTPWGSEELPPSRDIMGNPRLWPEGAIMNLVVPIKPSTLKDSKPLREIARLGIDLKGMKSTKRLSGHELNSTQSDKWAEEWGKLNTKAITPLVESPGYDKMPDGIKKMTLELILRKNKEAAKGVLMSEFPDELSNLKIEDVFQSLQETTQPSITPRRNFP